MKRKISLITLMGQKLQGAIHFDRQEKITAGNTLTIRL
jgi:hypothetical protein